MGWSGTASSLTVGLLPDVMAFDARAFDAHRLSFARVAGHYDSALAQVDELVARLPGEEFEMRYTTLVRKAFRR